MTEQDTDPDLHKEGLEAFRRAQDAEDENRDTGMKDLLFARHGEQWPDDIVSQREKEGRPCLTINKMPAFIRQVVNDARQNKPAIKVRPVDNNADKETAEVINGLIRNIEQVSSSDIAYDTAVDSAASNGFGYIRIGLDYAFEDTFDMDINIKRVVNPFNVYWDPYDESADGSDANNVFVVERIPLTEFKSKYGDKSSIDFEGEEWSDTESEWFDDDGVLVAEWWHRVEEDITIIQLSDGTVTTSADIEESVELQAMIEGGMITVTKERQSKRFNVTQHFMSGKEILESVDHPGKYIPVVPVYGEEYYIKGKKYLRSLIHAAKDPQRMFNFWRTASTELVALAPRTPYIGPKKAFESDRNKWNTSNTHSHAFITYDGPEAPQRQPLDSGPAAGALSEALNASDDMKAIVGLHDASLGARSNETSGVAIRERQREGDVSTFHFVDNLSRSIRHVGRVIIDLIPHVYNTERIIRVLGEDGTETEVPINQQYPMQDKNGQPQQQPTGQQDEEGNDVMDAVMAIHDLTVGKYDLTVSAGPSFTTRRQEAAYEMTEFVRSYPNAAPVIGGMIAKNMDWPGADEIAERLDSMIPAPANNGIPPELLQNLQMLQQENEQLKTEKSLEVRKLDIEEYEAQTDRIKVTAEIGAKIDEQSAPIHQPQGVNDNEQ